MGNKFIYRFPSWLREKKIKLSGHSAHNNVSIQRKIKEKPGNVHMWIWLLAPVTCTEKLSFFRSLCFNARTLGGSQFSFPAWSFLLGSQFSENLHGYQHGSSVSGFSLNRSPAGKWGEQGRNFKLLSIHDLFDIFTYLCLGMQMIFKFIFSTLASNCSN